MDTFAVAAQVGPHDSVTGVDITGEQLVKAERLVRQEMSHSASTGSRSSPLPRLADVAISSAVVNLSPDKRRVFAEAARVLRPYLADIAAAGLRLQLVQPNPR